MMSLSDDTQAGVIEAFNSTTRYLDDLLDIDNPYFERMVSQIYPAELQLNNANTSDTEAPFLDFHLSIIDGFVSSKIYDKKDYFNFDIVNFPFLCPATKSGGVLCYTLRTFECLSVRLSVRPSVRQRLIIRVRSITLIPFKIISRNLAQT